MRSEEYNTCLLSQNWDNHWTSSEYNCTFPLRQLCLEELEVRGPCTREIEIRKQAEASWAVL